MLSRPGCLEGPGYGCVTRFQSRQGLVMQPPFIETSEVKYPFCVIEVRVVAGRFLNNPQQISW